MGSKWVPGPFWPVRTEMSDGALEKTLPFSSKGASERWDSKELSFPLHDTVYNVKFGPDVPMAAESNLSTQQWEELRE